MRIDRVIRKRWESDDAGIDVAADEDLSAEDLRADEGRAQRDRLWLVSPNLAAPVDAAAIARIQADHDGDGADERAGEGRSPSS
jgi:hypothetical protein